MKLSKQSIDRTQSHLDRQKQGCFIKEEGYLYKRYRGKEFVCRIQQHLSDHVIQNTRRWCNNFCNPFNSIFYALYENNKSALKLIFCLELH